MPSACRCLMFVLSFSATKESNCNTKSLIKVPRRSFPRRVSNNGIDPEAAPIVKEIFKLYLQGNGIDTIARIMQEEGHLNCTAYWASKGINRGGKKTQPNPSLRGVF